MVSLNHLRSSFLNHGFIGMLWVLSPHASAQEDLVYFPLDSFMVMETPSTDYLRKLNYSDQQWYGKWDNGQLLFYDDWPPEYYGDSLPVPVDSLYDVVPCRMGYMRECHVLNAHNGWYVGSNNGEWGGALYWLSDDFKQCSLVCRGNVNQLLLYKDRVLMVEGLAHLGSAFGSLLEIHEDLRIDTLLTFDEAPRNVLVADEARVFLLTHKSIYTLNAESLDTSKLYTNESWPHLYNSQLFYAEGKLFAPMRGGIAMIESDSGEVKWLYRGD